MLILIAVILSVTINRQKNEDIAASQQNANRLTETSNENKVNANNANLENVSNVKSVKATNKSIAPTIPTPSPETKSSPQIKNEEKKKPSSLVRSCPAVCDQAENKQSTYLRNLVKSFFVWFCPKTPSNIGHIKRLAKPSKEIRFSRLQI